MALAGLFGSITMGTQLRELRERSAPLMNVPPETSEIRKLLSSNLIYYWQLLVYISHV